MEIFYIIKDIRSEILNELYNFSFLSDYNWNSSYESVRHIRKKEMYVEPKFVEPRRVERNTDSYP